LLRKPFRPFNINLTFRYSKICFKLYENFVFDLQMRDLFFPNYLHILSLWVDFNSIVEVIFLQSFYYPNKLGCTLKSLTLRNYKIFLFDSFFLSVLKSFHLSQICQRCFILTRCQKVICSAISPFGARNKFGKFCPSKH
jgi:hypothetical protein